MECVMSTRLTCSGVLLSCPDQEEKKTWFLTDVNCFVPPQKWAPVWPRARSSGVESASYCCSSRCRSWRGSRLFQEKTWSCFMFSTLWLWRFSNKTARKTQSTWGRRLLTTDTPDHLKLNVLRSHHCSVSAHVQTKSGVFDWVLNRLLLISWPLAAFAGGLLDCFFPLCPSYLILTTGLCRMAHLSVKKIITKQRHRQPGCVPVFWSVVSTGTLATARGRDHAGCTM